MLLQDIAFSIRAMRKAPGFTVIAVLTLALGMGATSSLFSVVRGVLLRPLPFPAPEQIVQLHTLVGGEERSGRDLSPPNFASLVEESRAFAGLSAVLAGRRTLSGVGEPISVAGTQVSAAFFDVMGVQPFLGRSFRPEENERGSARVTVLSHGLWQRLLGSDPAVLGRTIMLDGVAHTVVGVMPPDFSFPDESELWVALEYGSRYSATTTDGRYQNTWVPVLGRLHDGVGLERGRAELRTIGERLASAFPESNTGTSFTATPLREEIVADARTPLLLLLGAVSLVLLVACANLVGLQLVRGAARRGEMTVRAALGAGRPRLIRQLVTESAVLGLLGGGAGLLVAVWATNALVALRPEGIPRLESIGVDGVVLGFTALVAIGVGVLSGVVPALRATDSLAGTLRVTGRGSISQGNRLRSGIVVAQTALAVVLLIGAGLLLRSFARLIAVDPGFRYESVLAFRVALPSVDYDEESSHSFFERLLGTLEDSPGVQAAGAVNRLPISQGSFDTRFSVEGRPDPNDVQESIGVLSVTPGYFSAFGIPVVRGRGISATDRSDSPAVVVLNEAAVRRFFPDGADPIGGRLGRFAYDPVEAAADWFTIVGVVADARGQALSEAAEPEAFFAHTQVPLSTMQVVVRSAGDPAASREAIRSALTALDPRLPAPEIRPMERVVAESVARPRFITMLLTLFAAVALTLSAVGIFGLLSYSVARRTSEIGVRMALGARPREIVLQIVRHALGLAGIGIACGVVGALALTRVLQSQLFGIGAMDATTYVLVILLLAITALLSALIPARRAAMVDPIVALRQD